MAGAVGKRARVSLRVNPDVDPKTHPYISTGLKENKFGIAFEDALPTYRVAASLPNIEVTGIDCHIGSQLTDTAPFSAAVERVLSLVDALAAEGIALSHIDLGGGLGIQYEPEDQPPTSVQYAAAVLKALGARQETLLFEPGRFLTGNAGVLLARVEYLKRTAARNFAIVDAAMNDLMRPALYDAWHDIVPVRLPYTTLDWKRYYLRSMRTIAAKADHIVTVRGEGYRWE